MAFIRYVSQEDASEPLKRLYDLYSGPAGRVANILRIQSLNPPSMRGHVQFYQVLMRGKGPLTYAQREMIAVRVSALNRCHY